MTTDKRFAEGLLVENPQKHFAGNAMVAKPMQNKMLLTSRFWGTVILMLSSALSVYAATYTEVEPNGVVQYTDWLGLPSSKWQEQAFSPAFRKFNGESRQ